MIKLSDIVVDELLNGLSQPEFAEYVNGNNIRTLQDFFDNLYKLSSVNWEEIDRRMAPIFKNMEYHNSKRKEPLRFVTKGYSNPSLNKMDSLNKGKVLLLDSPSQKELTTFAIVKSMEIELIKRYLSLSRQNGENALISYANRLGPNNAERVVKAIDMFTEQIERQAKLTDRRDINLFEYELDAKRKVVMERIVDIIAYLIQDTKELVWEELSGYKRKIYESALTKDYMPETVLKNNLTEMIAGYTTMSELDDVRSGDYQVLRRFIRN